MTSLTQTVQSANSTTPQYIKTIIEALRLEAEQDEAMERPISARILRQSIAVIEALEAENARLRDELHAAGQQFEEVAARSALTGKGA